MKGLMRYLFLLFFLCFLAVPQAFFAKPYLKIQQVRSLDYPYIEVEVSLANIIPIKDINSAAFEVYENEWKINAFQVKKIEPGINPKNVILLVDSSGALTNRQFKMQGKAIQNFAKALNQNDRMALISFGGRVVNHCNFISNKIEMASCIQSVHRKGKKALLYDAIFASLKLAKKLGNQRHFIILFTDGRDHGSITMINDIMNKLNQVNTPIFAVVTGKKDNLKQISRLTHITGGRMYHISNTASLGKIYLLLNELFDNSFIIRYVSQASSTSLDGRKVELSIKVNSEEFKEEDTYSFFLHAFSLTDWLHKAKVDDRYLFFGIGIGTLLLFVVVIILIIRRTRMLPQASRQAAVPLSEDSAVHDLRNYIATKSEKEEEEMVPLHKTHSKAHHAKDSVGKKYQAYLVEKEGPNTGHKYKLNWENISIGYADENSVVIDDPLVSYEHARIKREHERFTLYDLLSENGTKLNGKKILRPASLRDFDEIQIGQTKLIFRKVPLK